MEILGLFTNSLVRNLIDLASAKDKKFCNTMYKQENMTNCHNDLTKMKSCRLLKDR